MNLKKKIAAFLSSALIIGAAFAASGVFPLFSVTAEYRAADAADAAYNPCNKQDDKEVPYDRTRWVQPAEWNCPAVDPRDYPGGIMLFADKIGLEPEYGPGKTQRIYVSVVGAEEPVNFIKLHLFYDTRLTVKCNSAGEPATAGKGVTGFTTGSALVEEGQIAFYASSDEAVQIDRGCLFTVDFTVPESAAPGDLYPIGFAYVDDGIVADCFINSEKSEAAKLQMTYLFTRGTYNGYIKIIGEKQTTTTTAAEPLWGDVDCSGDITLADAVLLYRIAAEDPCDGVSLTEQHIAAADCDSDNAITLLDAAKLLSYLQAEGAGQDAESD